MREWGCFIIEMEKCLKVNLNKEFLLKE
jgi:hypothetical protein